MLTIISYIFFLANLGILTKAYLKSEHVHSFSKKSEVKKWNESITVSFFSSSKDSNECKYITLIYEWLFFVSVERNFFEKRKWKLEDKTMLEEGGGHKYIFFFSLSLSLSPTHAQTHTHLEKLSSKIWFFISARAGKETSEPKHACVKQGDSKCVSVIERERERNGVLSEQE